MLSLHPNFKKDIEITTELIEAEKLMISICGLCKEFKNDSCKGIDVLCGRKYQIYLKSKKIEAKKLKKRNINNGRR